MRHAIIIFTVIFLILLLGAIPLGETVNTGIFSSLIFVIPCLVLCVSLIVCTLKQPLHWRKIGFYIMHWGIILVLGGALLSFLGGIETQFKLPINVPAKVIPSWDNKTLDLGFELNVKDFKVEYYPPAYNLYEITSSSGDPAPPDQYTYRATLKTNPAGLFVAGYGQISYEQMHKPDPDKNTVPPTYGWRSVLKLDQKHFLKIQPLTPRLFSATLALTPPGGKAQEASLRVNQPVAYGNWKFYLASYDANAEKFVVLSAYKDPGRLLVITGICLLIFSTFVVCWFNKSFLNFKNLKKEN